MLAFKSVADVKAWLSLRSRDAAVALSLRAALRALPALESATAYWMTSPANERGVVQIAFEFASAAWSSAISVKSDGHAVDRLRTQSSRLTLYAEQADLLFELRTQDITASANAGKACALAASVAESSAAEATAIAVGAIETSIAAAARASSSFHSDATEAENMLAACAADAALIEQGVSLGDILSRRLWIAPQPLWTVTSWEVLKAYIRSQHSNLEDYIAWYERCLRPPRPRPPRSELDYPPSDPAGLVSGPLGVAEESPEPFTPDLTMRPAMIEPVWHGDRLTLNDAPSFFDLGEEAFGHALTAYKAALADLAETSKQLSNCDPHIDRYLDRLSVWVSEAHPVGSTIYGIGHGMDGLRSHLATVETEWPSFPAGLYRTLLAQGDRLLRQSPSWRAFSQRYESSQQEELLTDQQASQAAVVTTAYTEVLEDEGADFVDPSIPVTLRFQTEALSSGEDNISQRLVYDQLESVSNLLKAQIARIADLTAPTFG